MFLFFVAFAVCYLFFAVCILCDVVLCNAVWYGGDGSFA